jgi:hypothetical protein
LDDPIPDDGRAGPIGGWPSALRHDIDKVVGLRFPGYFTLFSAPYPVVQSKSILLANRYMSDAYKETGLWRHSLGAELPSDSSGDHLNRLRSAYSIFRDRASQLTARISLALPDLTVHDVTHLDALWETADLIAGPDYPLNPMEGFVLGGAILLHDAALCFEAYDGGTEGLRRTLEWQDCYAAEKDRNPLGTESRPSGRR